MRIPQRACFTIKGAVDFEDLAAEVEFLDRCGAHGMVWPQSASLWRTLKNAFGGWKCWAQAARGKKPAVVLGVQAADTKLMLEFAEKAEMGMVPSAPKRIS